MREARTGQQDGAKNAVQEGETGVQTSPYVDSDPASIPRPEGLNQMRIRQRGGTPGVEKGQEGAMARHPKAGTHHRKSTRRWSRRVTETSDALDLQHGVFARDDPAAIARSLKRSAERSRRRKSDPYRSAMSMLVFYINRAGSRLTARRRRILERAKDELRSQFHRAK